MWWRSNDKKQYILCCTVTQEFVACSLFMGQAKPVPHIAKHIIYYPEVPFLLDGQLYNQTLVTSYIQNFLEGYPASIPAFLALDSSCGVQQCIVRGPGQTSDEFAAQQIPHQASMIYAQMSIWEDQQGNRYDVHSALEQHKYIPFLCAFVASKAQLVAAIPLTVAYMLAFRSVNALLFQESIEVDLYSRTWRLRMPEHQQTLLGYCTIDTTIDTEKQAEALWLQYGLYQAGRRLYEL